MVEEEAMAEETISEQGAPAGVSAGVGLDGAGAATEASSDGARAAAFLGETLGPLFLYEPVDGRARALMAELASLDVAEAAAAWPCVDAPVAAEALERIQRGLRDESADDVLWEYRRLFVGPARKAADFFRRRRCSKRPRGLAPPPPRSRKCH